MTEQRKGISAWTTGTGAAIAAYSIWGALPLYWIHLKHLSALELTSYRFLWATVILLAIVGLHPKLRRHITTSISSRGLPLLFASASFLALNSITYVLAINNGRMLEASLGYFLAPLMNIAIGLLFLKEKMAPVRWVASGFGFLAIIVLAVQAEHMPWLGLIIGLSACGYGLCRRASPLGALLSFLSDCTLLFPAAVGYLVFMHGGFIAATAVHSLSTHLLLGLGGVLTVIPFALFVYAIQRSGLTTIAFAQYLSPGIKFVLSLLVFHEPLTPGEAPAFALIWLGLIIVGVDSLTSWGLFKRTKDARKVLTE